MNQVPRRIDAASQAPDAPPAEDGAGRYLRTAVAEIDAIFGDGYARAHPELVASLVQAGAIDAAVATGRVAHTEALTAAQRISREMGETILKLKPRLFG